MMSAADTDGDGDVSLDEFKVIMRAGPRKLPNKVQEMMQDPDAMQGMLRNAREELEEVDLIIRLQGKNIESATKRELTAKRGVLEMRISTLNGFLAALSEPEDEAVDLEAAAREAEEAEAKKKREGGCGETTKMVVTVMKNTISGVLTIYLYFMDLISDYQVTKLFYDTGAYLFAFISASSSSASLQSCGCAFYPTCTSPTASTRCSVSHCRGQRACTCMHDDNVMCGYTSTHVMQDA